MNRRRFLRDSALASASVALMGAARFAAHAESALVLRESTALAPGLATRATQNGTA